MKKKIRFMQYFLLEFEDFILSNNWPIEKI